MPPDEPKPKPEIPKCPKHLDKEARKEWNRVTKEFADLGIISQLDMAVLASYCQEFSTWAKAQKKIQETGMVFTPTASVAVRKDGTEVKKQGTPMINPYFRVANDASDRMLRAAVELGITPSSRSRVKKIPKEKKSEEEKNKERFFK